jgi:hypothetical protein
MGELGNATPSRWNSCELSPTSIGFVAAHANLE